MTRNTDKSQHPFRLADVAQIAVGSCVLAFPVAATEEIWDLSEELSFGRVLLFALASLLFLAVFVYIFYHHHEPALNHKAFASRVLSTYFVTLMISALLLFGLDRLPLFTDFGLALKRSILVAFPASFAATVVDSLS